MEYNRCRIYIAANIVAIAHFTLFYNGLERSNVADASVHAATNYGLINGIPQDLLECEKTAFGTKIIFQ